jgi:RNA polymerase sigma factor (sigma-70 family)
MVDRTFSDNASKEAFEAFFRDDAARVHKFLMYAGASSSDAADILQNAFASAFIHWDAIRNPRAWVRKVAARDFARSTQLQHSIEARLHRAADLTAAEQTQSHDNSVVNYQVVRDVINEMPPRRRQIAVLYFLEEFNVTEIAEILEIAPSTVRVSLTKIRQELQKLFPRRPDEVETSTSTREASDRL